MRGCACVQIKPNLQKQDAAGWIWPIDHHVQLSPRLASEQIQSAWVLTCLLGPEKKGFSLMINQSYHTIVLCEAEKRGCPQQTVGGA